LGGGRGRGGGEGGWKTTKGRESGRSKGEKSRRNGGGGEME